MEALDNLLHLSKDAGGFFFISKWFYDTRIILELFEYGVYDILAYLRADLSQSLS